VATIRAQVAQAGTTNQYSTSFTEPYLFDKPVWGSINAYDQTTEYDGYNVQSLGFGVRSGKFYRLHCLIVKVRFRQICYTIIAGSINGTTAH